MKTFVLTKWKPPPPPDQLSAVAPHRISVMARVEDYECILLATMEKYTVKTIARITRLTPGQVNARLKAGGVSLRELRNGKGAYAGLARTSLTRERAQDVQSILRQQVSKQAAQKKLSESKSSK